MNNNIYNKFINKILKFPLWIKQAIYLKLVKEMEESYCRKFLDKESLNFVAYTPTVTFEGKIELSDKKCGFDNNLYNFLQYCLDGYSLIEICANTFLSPEEVAKILEFCIEQKFIENPQSDEIRATICYISGKCRLGEYLLQTGALDEQMLEDTIAICNDEKEKKFGEILIEKEYVKPEDLKAILILKEEAQKRFVFDYETLPQVNMECLDINQKSKNEIQLLKDENKKLKRQINHLLEFVKQNDSF